MKAIPNISEVGGPKSTIFSAGTRVAEIPGRAGSGRVGPGRDDSVFLHTLNNTLALRASHQSSTNRSLSNFGRYGFWPMGLPSGLLASLLADRPLAVPKMDPRLAPD